MVCVLCRSSPVSEADWPPGKGYQRLNVQQMSLYQQYHWAPVSSAFSEPHQIKASSAPCPAGGDKHTRISVSLRTNFKSIWTAASVWAQASSVYCRYPARILNISTVCLYILHNYNLSFISHQNVIECKW